MNAEFLSDILNINGISVSGDSAAKLCRMSELLVEFNEHTNLTAIKDERGIAVKHIADSLTLLKYIKNLPAGAKLLDVGAGGGFPSLPVAIARPDIEIVSLDSTAKKLRFITLASEELDLNNISVLCGRAEELGRNAGYRESFDIVTARAVARLKVLCELCIPFIKTGGSFIALKGADGENELDEAKKTYHILGCGEASVYPESLLGEDEPQSRVIITCRKISSTPPKYPRQYNQIIK